MKEKVLYEIEKKHKSSGGKCGSLLISLIQSCEISYEELRDCLNSLYAENKIKVREGINGKLIFKK